ncbi:MAG TPA: hypothetical protein PKC18_06285, partial [Lacipirellulaceae bacterium]|nr:hypothetical protein [Lacipirellulaceae bacterium]
MSRQTRSIDGFHVASLRSAMGHLAVATAACRVVGVTIGHRSAAEALARVERMLVGRLSATRGHDDRPRTDRWTSDVAERLVRYLAGEETSLVDIPIDVSHLSPFQQRVVAACRGIPRGRTSTYGTL